MMFNDGLKYINESIFCGIFCKSGRNRVKVRDISQQVFNVLRELDVESWGDFNNLKSFEIDILNTLVSQGVKNSELVEEVWFNIRFSISNKEELYIYLKELEKVEEYEKCKKVLNKIIKL